MEVYLYNSTVCRLCGEENDNGTFLYSCEENNTNLSEVINTYLPLKVCDDGQLPRTICPGCTIQLEAAVEFLTLIINGQKIIRELHLREREYKKTILSPAPEQDVITEKIVYEVNTSNGVYQVEHPIALQVAGLDKPKRKRGRPPKKLKTPEQLAQEAAAKEKEQKSAKRHERDDEPTGKRRRKTPTRFREAVQGKELDRIFKEEGVTDGEESDRDVRPSPGMDVKLPVSKEPEIIGHMENSGELVVFVKGKGRGRPKGPMRLTRRECTICGMAFSCAGRYMSHVAQHGPVMYQCQECNETFDTHINFANHQKQLSHSGKNIIQISKKAAQKLQHAQEAAKLDQDTLSQPSTAETPEVGENTLIENVVMTSLPDLNAQPVPSQPEADVLLAPATPTVEFVSCSSIDGAVTITDMPTNVVEEVTEKPTEEVVKEPAPTGKPRLKCNHCDKTFSSKQSKSLHIKATHSGERPYVCVECGARFAYPRSLALHGISHRRHRPNHAKGFACDLCGKVLNHPSSVVYHKEAEHAGQRYVCNKCGKSFKHKQLLQRHQLVHSQVRPYTCKTCDSSFKTKANLLNHQLLHTGVKKFSCEICKHKFAHKTSLTLHMRWHTGQKPYTCTTCGKSFSQKGNLSEHLRIHTGEKPFQCALCPRRFTTSSQHRLHARRHAAPPRRLSRSARPAPRAPPRPAGRAPQRCAVCARVFPERAALLKHMRTHAAERAHRCPHCPRAFLDCANLNKHKKQVHKPMSLLANSQPHQPLPAASTILPKLSPGICVEETQDDSLEERVIYVAYDVDEPDSPAFHILSPEQGERQYKLGFLRPEPDTSDKSAGLDDGKMLTSCELYSGPSLLVPQPELEQLEQFEQEELEHLVLDGHHEHMPVTDEQGNPLHFTMQDGTRLAITSADGKSLQVITQDGQTIPVEINGFAEEEEVSNPDTIVHQLNIQKSVEQEASAPVTHYFTIV